MKRTIGLVSHAMVERASVILNLGIFQKEVVGATSEELRKLASQLHAHLIIVPFYSCVAKLFGLPMDVKVRGAAKALIDLSSGLYSASENMCEINAKRVEGVCDSLGVYLDSDRRWPK